MNIRNHALPILAVIIVSIVALVGLQSVLGELSRLPDLTGEQAITKTPADIDWAGNGSESSKDGDKPPDSDSRGEAVTSEGGQNGQVPGILPSPTGTGAVACQSGMPPDIPVFTVKGAANTTLLRSTALAVYDGKEWRIASDAEYYGYDGEELNASAREYSSSSRDTITVTPIVEFAPGFIPTSLYTTGVSLDSPLRYYPAQFGFFSKSAFTTSYEFSTTHYVFNTSLLNAGQMISEEHYLQIPEVITERTGELAKEITNGLNTPYEKAKAIETYLRGNYEYNLSYERAPQDHEAVDWFLFDERRGVCINFNSAFVVLARAAGIPARLVTGFAIAPMAEEQEVSARQAHAWAEIPFVKYGWITFDATPPDNVPLTTGEIRKAGIATHIEITATGSVTRKGHPFEVEGTVRTVGGEDVDGIAVEIFLNETKDKGGTLIGEGWALEGHFKIECYLGKDVAVGGYQLIAHARGDDTYAESWSDPEVKVVSATTITLDVPGTVRVGDSLAIAGTLMEELGDPIPDQVMEVSLAGGAPATNLTTDDTGQFSLDHVFSQPGTYTITVEYKGTEYYLGTSAAADIDAMMPTNITLDLAGEALPGETVPIKGYLRDIRGRDIAGREIHIFIDGTMISREVTGNDGAFGTEHVFGAVGFHRVEARFAGFEYYLESSASELIQVLEVVIDVKTDGTLVRGEDALIGGVLRTKNGVLPHEALVILLDDLRLAELVTDEHGEFEITHHVSPDTTLGQHAIEYQVPGRARARTQHVMVKSRTFLDVQVPARISPGDKLKAMMTLQDDTGTPVGDASVFIEGYYPPDTTDGNGKAQIVVEVPDDVAGQSLSFKCAFMGTDQYLPCDRTVEVPLMRSTGFPWWVFAFIPVIGAAVAGSYMLRKRNRKEPPPQVDIISSESQPSVLPESERESGNLETRINVVLPQIKEPLPDVWGIDDELHIECMLTDGQGKPLASRHLIACIDGQINDQLATDKDGRADIAHTFKHKGEYIMECRFNGDDTCKPSQATRIIRVVDYREEIVALFAILREWAPANGAILPVGSTPREIEETISQKLQGVDSTALDTLVGCFEEADYSTHHIGRRRYEEAFLSLAQVRDSHGGQNGEGT